MYGDDKPIITDEDWTRAAESAIRVLSYKWAKSQYRLDVESAVWYAAGVLSTHPEEERTPRFLRYIADKLLFREANVKVRNVIVIDTSNLNVGDDISPYDVCSPISTNSLTEDELQFLKLIMDGYRLTDIATMKGIARSSVTRKWQKIIAKLKDENL